MFEPPCSFASPEWGEELERQLWVLSVTVLLCVGWFSPGCAHMLIHSGPLFLGPITEAIC